MCVYIYTYIYVYTHKRRYIYIKTHICIYIYIYMCIRTHIYIYVYIYIYTYVCIYIYMFTYICCNRRVMSLLQLVYTHVHVCAYIYMYICIYIYTHTHLSSCVCIFKNFSIATGWRRLIGCLKLQVIIRKRATNYRALLRKMTYEDKASYDSTPPCTQHSIKSHNRADV